MQLSSPHYLPSPLPFFSILAILLIVLIVFIEVRALRYAFLRIGLSSRAAFLVLLASLIGSYFNIPVVELPARQVLTNEEVQLFGMHYVVPRVEVWPRTVLAINVGGALIPAALSFYLVAKNRLWGRATLAVAIVAAVVHQVAQPVPGVGIAVPTFVPALAAVIVALVLSRDSAAPLAYAAGSLGTLIGGDLLNIGRLQGLGAPVASIGGAGTFDGVFVAGILAVLLAGFPGRAAHRAR